MYIFRHTHTLHTHTHHRRTHNTHTAEDMKLKKTLIAVGNPKPVYPVLYPTIPTRLRERGCRSQMVVHMTAAPYGCGRDL